MSTINVLVKARKIPSLNESTDWSEWNRKLKNYLSMIDLWKILTGESLESSVSDVAPSMTWRAIIRPKRQQWWPTIAPHARRGLHHHPAFIEEVRRLQVEATQALVSVVTTHHVERIRGFLVRCRLALLPCMSLLGLGERASLILRMRILLRTIRTCLCSGLKISITIREPSLKYHPSLLLPPQLWPRRLAVITFWDMYTLEWTKPSGARNETTFTYWDINCPKNRQFSGPEKLCSPGPWAAGFWRRGKHEWRRKEGVDL